MTSPFDRRVDGDERPSTRAGRLRPHAANKMGTIAETDDPKTG
jgi:hypothetical protein